MPGGDGIVVGPGPFRQQRRHLLDLRRRHPALEQLLHRLPHLVHRLPAHVGHDQRLIVHLLDRLLFHRLDDGGGGKLSELGIDGPQHRMFAHHDLVGGQRNQSTARHGVVGHVDGAFGGVLLDRTGDLQGRQHEPARGMEHDVERHVAVGHLDRPQHRLGIVDVDVAHHRKAQKPHRLLAVDEEDHPRVPLLLDLGDLAGAHRLQHALLDDRLQRRDDEEDPEQIHDGHGRLLQRPSGVKPSLPSSAK